MSNIPTPVTNDQIDDVRRWVINTVRQIMRGDRAKTQITRWLSGELGPSHSFSFPIVLDDKVYKALKNTMRKAEIAKEEL
jgi:hypothetical protein